MHTVPSQMDSSLLSIAWLASISILPIMLGCGESGPEIVPVSGRVSIDGQPLRHGFIRFLPDGWRASTGEIDSDGRFTLSCHQAGDGAAVGCHRIEITAAEQISEHELRWHAPKKYADASVSGLTYEISEPTSEVLFDLSWSGEKPFIEYVSE